MLSFHFQKDSEGVPASASDSGSEDDDVAASLKKEIDALKKTKANKTNKPFVQVHSGANNVLFIRTQYPNPNVIASSIFSDVLESGMAQSRFIMRFMPVLKTCRAQTDKIESLAEDILRPYFREDNPEGRSYAVIFKSRNSNLVSAQEVQEAIWKVVIGMSIKNRVNLNNPDIVVHVDVIRTVCCLCVLKDYKKFRKYNLQELTAGQVAAQNKEKTDDATATKSKSTSTASPATTMSAKTNEPTADATNDTVKVDTPPAEDIRSATVGSNKPEHCSSEKSAPEVTSIASNVQTDTSTSQPETQDDTDRTISRSEEAQSDETDEQLKVTGSKSEPN